MSPEQAGEFITSKISVTREDVARAKNWIVSARGTDVDDLVREWLQQQNIVDLKHVDTDATDCQDILMGIARAYSIRQAFYVAIWELINAGIIVAPDPRGHWAPPLVSKTARYAGGIPMPSVGFPHPSQIFRLPFASDATDTDIFLDGICKTLHPGIVEAVQQSLMCFRRALCMPATVMLAAAAEATWHECGAAVAKSLADIKLASTLSDSFVSIARVVSDVRQTLAQKNAKPLLQKAGLTIHQVTDAEIWTTALRDRRNALHWGKANSFVADHAETGTLLMASVQHLKTLEAIRASC